jgi:hypothetical protein
MQVTIFEVLCSVCRSLRDFVWEWGVISAGFVGEIEGPVPHLLDVPLPGFEGVYFGARERVPKAYPPAVCAAA